MWTKVEKLHSEFITVLFIYPILIIGALLKCTVAKIGFEKKKISQGFEALARAQCLLRSKPSLAKMTLLSQVRKFLIIVYLF